jgi:hypothetical protein
MIVIQTQVSESEKEETEEPQIKEGYMQAIASMGDNLHLGGDVEIRSGEGNVNEELEARLEEQIIAIRDKIRRGDLLDYQCKER